MCKQSLPFGAVGIIVPTAEDNVTAKSKSACAEFAASFISTGVVVNTHSTEIMTEA